MNPLRIAVPALVIALLAALLSGPAAAGAIGGSPLFSPRVPVSAFGLARNWFDPSRLHVSSMVSVGSSSWGSRGTSALQVTTLSYSFKAPVAMSVSLGNAWGANTARSAAVVVPPGLQPRVPAEPRDAVPDPVPGSALAAAVPAARFRRSGALGLLRLPGPRPRPGPAARAASLHCLPRSRGRRPAPGRGFRAAGAGPLIPWRAGESVGADEKRSRERRGRPTPGAWAGARRASP